MGQCFAFFNKNRHNQDSLMDSSQGGSDYSKSEGSICQEDPTFQQENEQFKTKGTETIFIKN